MNLVSKYFADLTTRELYEILKARSAVFVVEQNCVYQDIDGQDPESLHVFFEDEGRIAAYLRAFVKEPGVVQMGRVLTVRRQAGSARVSIGVSFERQLRWMSVPRAVVRVDHSRQGVDPALLREHGGIRVRMQGMG